MPPQSKDYLPVLELSYERIDVLGYGRHNIGSKISICSKIITNNKALSGSFFKFRLPFETLSSHGAAVSQYSDTSYSYREARSDGMMTPSDVSYSAL